MLRLESISGGGSVPRPNKNITKLPCTPTIQSGVSIDPSLPRDAVGGNWFLTAVVKRKPRRRKRINLNDIDSLLGIVLPLLPHFTHISLTATALAQMLAHVASSNCGLTACLVATSSLHCLSPKYQVKLELNMNSEKKACLLAQMISRFWDLREMRKYGT